MHSLNSYAAAIACVVMILTVVALVPVYPAKGIPVLPVRVSNDCGDGREIVLRITADGDLTLNGRSIRRDDLEIELDERLRTRFEKIVLVEADGSMSFHLVAEVLGRVQSRGRVALIPQLSGDRSFTCLAIPGGARWMPGTIALPNPSLRYVAPWAR